MRPDTTPIEVCCPVCLAPSGEACSDGPRRGHGLRRLAADVKTCQRRLRRAGRPYGVRAAFNEVLSLRCSRRAQS